MQTDSYDPQLGTHAHFTPHVDLLMGYVLVGICIFVPSLLPSIFM